MNTKNLQIDKFSDKIRSLLNEGNYRHKFNIVNAEEMFGNLFTEAEIVAARSSSLQAKIDKPQSASYKLQVAKLHVPP